MSGEDLLTDNSALTAFAGGAGNSSQASPDRDEAGADEANDVPLPTARAEVLTSANEANTALMSSPDVRFLSVKSIQVGRRARSLDPEQVDALAKSIKQLGLKTPITVRIAKTLVVDGVEEKDVPVLVAGLHRLEAAKRLKHEEIPCFILEGAELDAELWEVDENLCRAELSKLEQGEHLLRRKTIYEKLHPETRLGGLPGAPGGGKAKTANLVSFATDAAAKTGIGETTLRRNTRRAKGIEAAVRDRIRGKKEIADNGEELDALVSLSPYHQKRAVDLIDEGKVANVRDAKFLLQGSTLSNVATPVPQGDNDFAWEDGARQLIEFLVEAVITLESIPNETKIGDLLKYCRLDDLLTKFLNRGGRDRSVTDLGPA